MTSAQVMRKQEHLEAGKRRLEEFRRKKVAEQAKKTASDVRPHEKRPLETGPIRITDSEGAGTSDVPGQAFMGLSPAVTDNDDKKNVFPIKNEQEFLNDTLASHQLSAKDYDTNSVDSVHTHSDNTKYKRYGASGFAELMNANHGHEKEGRKNDFGIYTGVRDGLPYETATDQSILPQPQASQGLDSTIGKSSLYGTDKTQSTKSGSSLLQSSARVSPLEAGGTLPQAYSSNASMLISAHTSSSFYDDSIQPTTNVRGQYMNGVAHISDAMILNFGERKLSGSASDLPGAYNAAPQAFETTGFSSDIRSSSNHVPLFSVTTEMNPRRSRPSFLDSLNVPRASSGTLFQHTEPEESFMSNSSNTNSMDVLGPSFFQKPSVESGSMETSLKLKTPNGPSSINQSVNSSFNSSNGGFLRPIISENSMDMKEDFYSAKHNEDFAALEQHIEDLTQEKFSLQRALEASRTLAESLAAENSSMTDSYNQQRSVVNQLKSDMEILQEEIKARLVELESLKVEYANAQLECNAADERAKLLASEVIGLEEKALRLRSSELKLERQLENSQAEISSYKKKISSLEKDRQDLQSTMDALQEEKKLLQSKLRKASTSATSIDFSNITHNKRDMFTSTEDLDVSIHETDQNASSLVSDASSVSLLPQNGQSTPEVSYVNVLPDQMRMIQNINTLISELALEKEELMQALASESSHCSKLKELNKDLSRKLEAQTQRMELLTAQSMANAIIPARQPDSHIMHENTPYADEGDEVVERVLGWIMKLFPGGPSKRRTSKLL
ncbi:protein BLISTER-like [Juglans microcarpa x Juglans regia]|uniref:protein BLISTER-like n=1 Tax=Juglans microcarpa x Juglans regia TaxID=2249226 RepID=UPI001B7EAEA5|nr:protein BLISTER-like [Juglans microcarpa x Juglans regia]